MRFPTVKDREKRSKLAELLDVGKVRIVIDTLVDGVDVPTAFHGQRALHLNLSHRFNLDVLEVGPQAVRASLSFGGVRHLCVIPWPGIYVIAGNGLTEQIVYPESAPDAPEAAPDALASGPSPVPDPETPPPDAEEPPDPDEGPDEPPEEPPPRPRLRLVKS